jgi:hypothetical protein
MHYALNQEGGKTKMNVFQSGLNVLKKMNEQQVKLRFCTCGEIMIDGLPFTFGVESIGRESQKGLCVTLSGEAVDNGQVTFSDLEYHEMHGGNVTIVKHDFPLVKKKDGKKIYQAKFSKIPIIQCQPSGFFRKTTEEDIINQVNAQLSFRVTPHYSGSDNPEVMLSVYPYENPMTGSATEWKNVTSDQDYFYHRLKK